MNIRKECVSVLNIMNGLVIGVERGDNVAVLSVVKVVVVVNEESFVLNFAELNVNGVGVGVGVGVCV